MLVQMFNPADGGNIEGYTDLVDMWCLGITMFKLLHGRLIFGEEQIASLVAYLRISPESRSTTMFELKKDYDNFLNECLSGKNELFSDDTGKLIIDLLQIEYTERIGYGSSGLKNIKDHKCFIGIDWNRLERRSMLPPFVPNELQRKSDEIIHASFFDCINAVNRRIWDMPGPADDEVCHFASWSFVSAGALMNEVELVQAREDEKLLADINSGSNQRENPEPGSAGNIFHSLLNSLSVGSTIAPETTPRKINYTNSADMLQSIERKCVAAESNASYDQTLY